MNIKPLFDRVLLTSHKQTPSRTLIASNENEGNKMVVLKTGTNHDFIVKEGDIVLINTYAGSEFIIDGTKYYLIKENDILAIVNKEDENE